jgi:quercetin dioxygenase-like cupin family protein
MVKRVSAMVVWALCCSAAGASAQALGQGSDKARPVTGDPGVSSMVVLDQPTFRVLRDFAEPGAIRRLHRHADVTYHVMTLVSGTLRVTSEGESPVDVNAGDVLSLQPGVMHIFTNIGQVTATIVEVFGKAPPATRQ